MLRLTLRFVSGQLWVIDSVMPVKTHVLTRNQRYLQPMATRRPFHPNPTMPWYVVSTPSGEESALRKYLLRRVRALKLDKQIGETLIPTEPFFQWTWQGRRLSRRRAYPGYLFLQIAPRARSTVRALLAEVPVEARLLGRRPISPDDMAQILRLIANRRPLPVSYQKGERVQVMEGPFEGACGLVEALSPEENQLHIQIELFCRKFRITLNPDQVEKIR